MSWSCLLSLLYLEDTQITKQAFPGQLRPTCKLDSLPWFQFLKYSNNSLGSAASMPTERPMPAVTQAVERKFGPFIATAAASLFRCPEPEGFQRQAAWTATRSQVWVAAGSRAQLSPVPQPECAWNAATEGKKHLRQVMPSQQWLDWSCRWGLTFWLQAFALLAQKKKKECTKAKWLYGCFK